MLRHGWLMHGSRFGGRRSCIGDSHDLEDANILSGMQAKRLWAVVVDGYPQFRAARKCGNSGHKRWQSVFWTEVDVLGRPRVMTADYPCSLRRNVLSLQQQSAASCVGSGGRQSDFLWRGG